MTDRDPAEYLEEFIQKNPGAVETHWIPMDRNLWKIENYQDFLTARRELLAEAANNFLDGLLAGNIPEKKVADAASAECGNQLGGGLASQDEENLLIDYNLWVVNQGLPEGEFSYEIIDTATGELKAVIDLAWANGLQEGLSQPVALLIDEETQTEEAVNRAGFRFFTDFEEFKEYVKSDVLAGAAVN